MSIQLNHTIVNSRDPRAAATELASLLGVNAPVPFGPFLGVKVDNGVTLDFVDAGEEEVQVQHYAFLVGDDDFDRIFGRIQERGMPYAADPFMRQVGTINTHFGGRGVYWNDPSGHVMEIITRPYGKWEDVAR